MTRDKIIPCLVDQDVAAQSSKCARRGCERPHLPEEIWCKAHRDCGPATTCDNVPAIPEATPLAARAPEENPVRDLLLTCLELNTEETLREIERGLRPESRRRGLVSSQPSVELPARAARMLAQAVADLSAFQHQLAHERDPDGRPSQLSAASTWRIAQAIYHATTALDLCRMTAQASPRPLTPS